MNSFLSASFHGEAKTDPLLTMNPERVLVAGDTHHDTQWYMHLLKVAKRENCSVIVQLGDFGFFPNTDYGQEFLTSVSKKSVELGILNVFIKGNHDDASELELLEVQASGFAQALPGIVYAPTGHRWEWQGVSFAAAGGAVSYDRALRVEGLNWWRNETLSYSEATKLIYSGEVDVLLTHDSPAETLDGYFSAPDSEGDGHRSSISMLMEEMNPRMLFHGHYHMNYSREVQHASGTTLVKSLGMNEEEHKDTGEGYFVLELPF